MKCSVFKIKTSIQYGLNFIKWTVLDVVALPIFWIIKQLSKINKTL